MDDKTHPCTQRCECDRYGADRYPENDNDDTQTSGKHTVQTRVNGSANVGGTIGMMAGGSIDGLHTQIQEVQGSNDIGGFVGKVFSSSRITITKRGVAGWNPAQWVAAYGKAIAA